MAIYRKGEGLWTRGTCAAVLFGTALFGCARLAQSLMLFSWARSVLLETPVGILSGAWAASGLLLVFCLAGIWVLMNHAKAVDFLVDTESELRKVTWPVDPGQPKFADRYRELTQSTVIVILSVLVMAAALFLYDVLLGTVLGRLLRA